MCYDSSSCQGTVADALHIDRVPLHSCSASLGCSADFHLSRDVRIDVAVAKVFCSQNAREVTKGPRDLLAV